MSRAGKKKSMRGFLRRAVTALLLIALLFPYFSDLQPAHKAEAAKVLRLSQVKAIALANSEKIEALDIQIEAKEAAKVSAVRSITEKWNNMQTFRWSPLLNFKFPEKPNEAEDFEVKYKPEQLQADIDILKHKKTDTKLQIYEKVSNIYIDIITSTMEIGFLKERILTMETTILKNKARLAEGTATQSQIDQQQSKLTGFKNSLASEETKLQRSKEKLGRELGFDVTQGYTFEEVFISSNMSRDCIPELQYAAMASSMSDAKEILDETVYEAKQAETLAKLALNTNAELLKSQYGGDYNMISGYVSQALDGSKINKRAFKKDYDAFLKKIDSPWQGSKKILFFRFPKVWWKGEIDGIRYVEDDPYVLYSAALEYESALKEYNNARKDLENAITDGFDAYIETRKAYLTAKDDLLDLQNKLIYDEALNALGQLSLEEYEGELTEYENARTALKDALALYSTTLYSFDRTCCGGASKYFVEESLSTLAGHAGLGTVEDTGDVDEDIANLNITVQKGAIYSIRSVTDSQEFMLYIDIPENFKYNITDFELWSDGRQIGARTAKTEAIRHLTITVQDVDTVFIRLYDGDTFIDDCAIDPTVATGPLNIREAEVPDLDDETKVIGSYTVEEDANTDMIRLRFTFISKAVEQNFPLGSIVEYYNICAEQNLYLFSDELVAQDQPFSYMSFIKNDLDKLTLRMFAEDGSYIGGAYFDTAKKRLIADTDVTEADMQEMAARELIKKRKRQATEEELARMKELLEAAKLASPQEADSATVTYYKKRVAELEEKLANIGNDITEQEIQDCLESDGALIEQMAAQMSRAGEEDEAGSEEGISREEADARAVILREAAEAVAKQLKIEAETKSIDAAIREKQTQLARAMISVPAGLRMGPGKGGTASNDAKVTALQKEIDNLKAKKAALSTDETSVSEEEILDVLLNNADKVYSQAADKLSEPMLYGSETGQYCTALLENRGMPVTEENLRLVIKQAGNIETYDALLARKAILEKERDEAKAKADAFRKRDTSVSDEKLTSSVTDESLAEQLEKIEKAYSAELKKLEKDIKKNDPAKEVILKEARQEKADLDARIRYDNEAEALLICSNYNGMSEYTSIKVADHEAAVVWLDSLNDKKQKEKDRLNKDISTYEKLILSRDQVIRERDESLDQMNSYLKVLESIRDEKKAEYEEAKNSFLNTFYDYAKSYRQVYEAYENAVTACKDQIDQEVKHYETILDEIDSASEQIGSLYEQLAGLDEKYAAMIAAATEEENRTAEALEQAKKEWNDSIAAYNGYEDDISECKKRIAELDGIISEYY